jgi:hypothetical protein
MRSSVLILDILVWIADAFDVLGHGALSYRGNVSALGLYETRYSKSCHAGHSAGITSHILSLLLLPFAIDSCRRVADLNASRGFPALIQKLQRGWRLGR